MFQIISYRSEKQLIDIFNISYLVQGKNICDKRNGNLDYIIFVHSAPNHFKKRHFVRSSWGKPNLMKGYYSRVIFILGTTNNHILTKKIYEEIKVHGDIIQANFLDTRLHLSLKAISGINWVVNFCSNVQYIIKADDDVIVNIFKLMPYVKNIFKKNKRSIICRTNSRMLAKISWKKCPKWALTQKIKKQLKCEYPTFCSGFLFVFPFSVLLDMYESAFSEPIYYVDDVYVTGALALKSNITLLNANFIYYGHYKISSKWLAACPMNIKDLWQKTSSLLWMNISKNN